VPRHDLAVRVETVRLAYRPLTEHVQVELYGHVPNFAVLRLPTRRFPGVLIQGDSLVLCGQAQAVLAALEGGDLDDARDEARYLVDDLKQRVRAYVDVLDGPASLCRSGHPRRRSSQTPGHRRTLTDHRSGLATYRMTRTGNQKPTRNA